MIYVIINPYSRVNILHPDLKDILVKIIGEYGKVFKTKTLEEQDELITEAYKEGVDTIGVCGGDGTVTRTLTSIYKAYKSGTYPKVLFLKGGTINFLAHNLGLTSSPQKTLSWYVGKLKTGEELTTQELQTLDIEDKLGFLFVDGVGVNFLQKFYANKKGPISSAILFLKMLCSTFTNGKEARKLMQTRDIWYEYKNETRIEGGSGGSLLFLSTVTKIPFGIKFFQKIDQGLFNGVCLRFKPGMKFLFKIHRYFFNTGRGRERKQFEASSVKLENRGILDEYVYSIDGEVFTKKVEEKTLLQVKLGPSFNFIVKK